MVNHYIPSAWRDETTRLIDSCITSTLNTLYPVIQYHHTHGKFKEMLALPCRVTSASWRPPTSQCYETVLEIAEGCRMLLHREKCMTLLAKRRIERKGNCWTIQAVVELKLYWSFIWIRLAGDREGIRHRRLGHPCTNVEKYVDSVRPYFF